ncbi:small acid-soluble spore protein (thioredoxin-like protein) [Thalassobacillus cyri]|uniref:Small, acid-soluble spore protein Tlp n=1 Tax=Thalassobacillus cyri TaxID=571932 RepID=A0A1H4GWS9_9BACI|nr:small acid-soluble spore protein Tlp [Thalassobacillus cyri]SEB14099.1 small acid-soluble spore protein (thioredoxin-like protein) [Thalassobacillus cyri]
MTEKQRHPNPDDRSDNVEKLQHMVQDTIENIEDSHDAYPMANEEEKRAIAEKNKRREESINAMRSEIKDEARHNQQ